MNNNCMTDGSLPHSREVRATNLRRFLLEHDVECFGGSEMLINTGFTRPIEVTKQK